MKDKVGVAVVGLGFGGEFVPIYQAYEKTECVAVCRRNEAELNKFADELGVEKRYTDYDELLKDPDIDAVHINTDLLSHYSFVEKALKAGKHVASTVPMGMTVVECENICKLEKETGKVYMLMETSVYTREFLYFKDMYEKGEVGRLQFLRGSHQQNMGLPGWPSYWYGMPPMHYPTHAIAPLSEILQKPIKTIRCIGSGRIQEEYIPQYNSPFAAESVQLTFADTDVQGEVTRTLFNTIRQYRESFDFYGSKKSFEWEQCVGEGPVIYTGYEDAEHVHVPDTDWMLPASIGKFALKNQIIDKEHVSFIQGDGHGGSHPHMVYEFINAILENRPAHINSTVAANWNVAGILAHESAMRGGEIIEMPEFTQF